MNENCKQLWCDIQHYGEVLSKVDESEYDNFYTKRTHKYEGEIYKSVMLNGELIVLLKICDYYICSFTNVENLFDRGDIICQWNSRL